MRTKIGFLAALIAIFAATAQAAPRRDSLQARIDRARPGDRILVRGGRHDAVRIPATKTGLVLVGVHARLEGVVVEASGVRVEGFRFPKGRLVVLGEAATIEGNTFAGDPRSMVATTFGASGATGPRLAADIRADGATFSNNAVDSSMVLVASNRARIVGTRGGQVRITGRGVEFRRNSTGLVDVRGDDFVAEDNDSVQYGWTGGFLVRGDRAVLRRNATGAGIDVVGDGATVEDNPFSSGTIIVAGDGALVRANRIEQAAQIAVAGDGAVVTGNTLLVAAPGIQVKGSGFEVSDNVVEVDLAEHCLSRDSSYSYGIRVTATGPGATVERNRVAGNRLRGIHVVGEGVTVRANQITEWHDSNGIVVDGRSNTIVENVLQHQTVSGASQTTPAPATGESITVVGDENVVASNEITGSLGVGIVVDFGSSNVLESNTIDGGRISGIQVSASTSGTEIQSNTVTGCQAGIVNDGSGTTLANSTVTGSEGIDIVDHGNFAVFVGNVFDTIWRLPPPVPASR